MTLTVNVTVAICTWNRAKLLDQTLTEMRATSHPTEDQVGTAGCEQQLHRRDGRRYFETIETSCRSDDSSSGRLDYRMPGIARSARHEEN